MSSLQLPLELAAMASRWIPALVESRCVDCPLLFEGDIKKKGAYFLTIEMLQHL